MSWIIGEQNELKAFLIIAISFFYEVQVSILIQQLKKMNKWDSNSVEMFHKIFFTKDPISFYFYEKSKYGIGIHKLL